MSIYLAVRVSQSLMVLSKDPVITTDPLLSNWLAITSPVCPLNVLKFWPEDSCKTLMDILCLYLSIYSRPVTALNNLVVVSIDEVATICLVWQKSTATISPECPRMVHKHSPLSFSDHILAVLSKDPVNTLKNCVDKI